MKKGTHSAQDLEDRCYYCSSVGYYSDSQLPQWWLDQYNNIIHWLKFLCPTLCTIDLYLFIKLPAVMCTPPPSPSNLPVYMQMEVQLPQYFHAHSGLRAADPMDSQAWIISLPSSPPGHSETVFYANCKEQREVEIWLEHWSLWDLSLLYPSRLRITKRVLLSPAYWLVIQPTINKIFVFSNFVSALMKFWVLWLYQNVSFLFNFCHLFLFVMDCSTLPLCC